MSGYEDSIMNRAEDLEAAHQRGFDEGFEEGKTSSCPELANLKAMIRAQREVLLAAHDFLLRERVKTASEVQFMAGRIAATLKLPIPTSTARRAG